MDASRHTTVFTKRPRAGEVKTRLTPPLSGEEAALLAQAMLDDTLECHLAADAYATGAAIAPRPEADDLAWLRARYPDLHHAAEQDGGSLGERMANWFARPAAAGRTQVVVGSDCPLLGPRAVTEAHLALERGADAVFCPDAGGGYSLVGLARPARELFVDVPMSTPDMFERTLAAARRLDLRVVLLPMIDDVDEPADLRRLLRELDIAPGGSDHPARTLACLRELAPLYR